jgi:hypothetical protein
MDQGIYVGWKYLFKLIFSLENYRMSLLNVQIKRNQFKAPRIFISSATTKKLFGSFSADNPKTFKDWGKLNPAESCELKHIMDNFEAIKEYLGSDALLEAHSNIRLVLPMTLIKMIERISLLSHEAESDINIYEGIILAIIQNLKGAVAKLPFVQKKEALALLETLGLAEYKKKDYSNEVKAVFSELLSVFNKSEKLKEKASSLFQKPKSFSPLTFENLALAEHTPSKWVVACAIDVLLSEKLQIVLKMLSADDIAILWAKPLLNNNQTEYVYNRITGLGLSQVQDIIESENFPIKQKIDE